MKKLIGLFFIFTVYVQPSSACRCVPKGSDKELLASLPNSFIGTVVENKNGVARVKVDKIISGRQVEDIELLPSKDCLFRDFADLKVGDRVMAGANSKLVDKTGSKFQLSTCEPFVRETENAEIFKWATNGGLAEERARISKKRKSTPEK